MARFERGDQVFDITSNDGRYKQELRKHLREGWRRVVDPRCETPLGAEPMDPVLEAALRADPDDIGAALVYADWLQQRGHPRGALIAIQHRLAGDSKNTVLLDEERRLIEAGDALVSKPLRAQVALRRKGGASIASNNLHDGGTITFDHGFVRAAELELRARGGDEDTLWELLRHPSARVLASLGVSVDAHCDPTLVAALLTHGPRPTLRTLRLHVRDENPRITIDLSNLDVAQPALETLSIRVVRMHFGRLDLPRLRRLELAGTSDVANVLATLPALESLAFTKPDPRRLVLENPNLRELRIGDCSEKSLELCRVITRAPIAKQLRVLDLATVHLPAEAVTMLVECRDNFAALTELAVTKTHVRANDVDRLRDAGYPVK